MADPAYEIGFNASIARGPTWRLDPYNIAFLQYGLTVNRQITSQPPNPPKKGG